MKNLLIPTDFTERSLNTIEAAVRFLEHQKLNIILFHAFEMPSSMQDIAGLSGKPHLQGMNEPFRKGCKRIKEKFADQVGQIQYRHMYGNSKQVFRNFIEFNNIDLIAFPDGISLQAVHKRSVDPSAMIAKSGISVLRKLNTDISFQTIRLGLGQTELTATNL